MRRRTGAGAPGSAGVPPACGDRDARARRVVREAPWRLVPDPEWCSRGYLPHRDALNLVQTVTFRLSDSLPACVVERLQRVKDEPERRRRTEVYLDAGYGACYLRGTAVAGMVEGALLHFDGARYRMLAWSVMPNHVHALFEPLPDQSLERVIHSWKSFTVHEANRMLARSGEFWEPDYFDRYIRDEEHYANAVRYIARNRSRFSSAARESRPWEQAGETPALPGRLPVQHPVAEKQ